MGEQEDLQPDDHVEVLSQHGHLFPGYILVAREVYPDGVVHVYGRNLGGSHWIPRAKLRKTLERP